MDKIIKEKAIDFDEVPIDEPEDAWDEADFYDESDNEVEQTFRFIGVKQVRYEVRKMIDRATKPLNEKIDKLQDRVNMLEADRAKDYGYSMPQPECQPDEPEDIAKLEKIATARQIMREAFENDPEWKTTYVMNIEMLMYDILGSDNHGDRIGKQIAEKILDRVFEK